ncbi:hypothetical protein Y032_0167g136 [Ancylostoma ceylanicum]|uniref:Serine carboxypeptidase S28 n=1 Tax=Ancylostoma ceylanicum TaxID=53326 RepID=A0A016SWD1_9BILA|nr:hypothetical protein Y032_0167g136 [Ancylostoma ceylanicum]
MTAIFFPNSNSKATNVAVDRGRGLVNEEDGREARCLTASVFTGAMTKCALLFALLVQIWAAHSWQPKFHLGRAMFGMQTDDERFTMRNPDKELNLPKLSDAKEEYFDQKLDHFDGSSQQTWRQRYYHNFQYTSGSNNIKTVFLRLGGEGPLRMSTVSNEATPMMTLAKEHGAAVFALEHRFYGASRPTPNQSVKNLKYLSSRQALKDVAYFIQEMNKKYKLEGARWVTFGGSYSGALSLWFRQQYPELVVGAVGSSAPLDAEFDFWGYLEVVEDALRTQHSNDCAENVRKGFKEIRELMKTKEGRDQLSEIFKLKAPLSGLELSYNDIQYFYMVLYENFQMATQYNEVNVNPFNNAFGIKHVCDIMTKGNDDPIKKIQAVNVYMADLRGGFEHTDNSYEDMVNYLGREEFDGENFDSGARSWTWQTCTEFGYYQTTDGGPNGIFVNFSVFVNMCTDVFGKKFHANYTYTAILATQAHYGGVEGFKATNVVIPNGSVDPWHRLGKLASDVASVVTYLMKGTAHCAEMSPPGPNDKPDLKKVREIIKQNIAKWLKEPRSQLPANTKPLMKPVMRRARTTYPKQEEGTAEEPILLSQMKFPSWTRHRRTFVGRPPQGFVNPPRNVTQEEFEPQFITQPFDHFNPNDQRTFRQKYYENNKWARLGGPVFLYIGGESPLNSGFVKGYNIYYQHLAVVMGATVFALEHRYYGDSIVGGTAEDPNPDLTYLSSWQMIHDVANFIETMNAKMETKSKWILFGGSYSANLALWFRSAFPDLVNGAVGSSAPVEAKFDFYEYMEAAEKSFIKYQPQCAARIAEGFEEMHRLVLTKAGRKQLTDTFRLVPPWNENSIVSDEDIQYFFQTIYSVFGAAAQQDFRYQVCTEMVFSGATALQNVARVNELFNGEWQGQYFNGTESSYTDFVAFLKTAHKYGPVAASMKLWIWQTCTEFGYFQSTDSGYNIFGSPTPVNLYTRTCLDVFGDKYKAVNIEKNVRATNKLYGGRDHYKGSNALATNGNVDPWHALGMYKAKDKSVVTFLMDDVAHCADIFQPQIVHFDIIVAQSLMDKLVKEWLSQEMSPRPTTKQVTSTPRPTTEGMSSTLQPTRNPTRGTSISAEVCHFFLMTTVTTKLEVILSTWNMHSFLIWGLNTGEICIC